MNLIGSYNMGLIRKFRHYIQKNRSVSHYDKRHESDWQMLKRIGGKFAVVFFLILISDTLLDWLLGLIDLLFEFLHIIIELVEYSFEVILEHTLHTDHYHNEVVIVNVAIIFSL